MSASFTTELSYCQLANEFSTSCSPSPVSAPQWLAFNQPLAAELGLPEAFWGTEAGLQLFAGNQLPDWAQPHALAYSGHQFGHFNPHLGDGRAILLTEIVTPEGQRFDLQLKGSGRTPYSRRGDGRSAIGPVIREYLVSEAMHHLGVPTTRALAAVATGDWVQREQAQPGAILARVARSHLRVGTAQYVLNLNSAAKLKSFADYLIERHYPEIILQHAPGFARYDALLSAVIERQAQLIAQWMSLGFIHGVMNTDNMSLVGDTIDYGPCAFMEAYNEHQVFSFIDKQGRYAYANQPAMAQWNLARFAETLLPIMTANDAPEPEAAIAATIERATELVMGFSDKYQQYYQAYFSAKIGLSADHPEASKLVQQLLAIMQQQHIDFTLAFRYLGDAEPNRRNHLFSNSASWLTWHQQWLHATASTPTHQLQRQLNEVNPALIPRNHLIEDCINEVIKTGSLAQFVRLQQAFAQPYQERAEYADLMPPATASQQVTTTFCGT